MPALLASPYHATSQNPQDSLKALKTDYETALRRDSDSEATAKRLIRASRVMSEDLAAWEELYGRKRLELPA